MKLQKLICLGFSGKELEANYWQEVDALVGSRVLIANSIEIGNNRDADGLLVKLGAKVGKETIDMFPNLKYIGMLGTGYGGIDTAYAASKGVTVTNIADYATEGVAEFTFGILIEWCRGVYRALDLARDGIYEDDDHPGMEIKGKKFGVIGLGHIGKRKQGNQYDKKTPLLAAVEVGGHVRTRVVPRAHSQYTLPFLEDYVYEGSTLHTDESKLYHHLKVKQSYNHESIRHYAKEFVKDGVTTNHVEGFFGQLKRSLDGTFHAVSPYYLHSYVSEFAFRYNHRNELIFPLLLARAAQPVSAIR